MKKLIFALAAVVALAACSKEQTIVTDRGDAIGFGNPFIENATRAVANEFNTVDSFQVWGNVTGNAGSIFLYNGALVERNGAEDGAPFTCEQTEYWIPSATYNFLAISGANSVAPTTGFPTEISYTATGSNDLLLSEYVEVKTDGKAMPTTGVNDNDCVPFTFKHLLSKVYFNFTNTSTSDKSTYEISEIKISGAKATSSYNIATETWATASGTASDFVFGDAGTIAQGASATSENACLFIPGEQNLTVSFTQTYKYNGTAVNNPETVTATLTPNPTFAANGCYVINVELKGGVAISFTVDEQKGLNGWDSKTDISIP